MNSKGVMRGKDISAIFLGSLCDLFSDENSAFSGVARRGLRKVAAVHTDAQA
jgi:hypothetical protein